MQTSPSLGSPQRKKPPASSSPASSDLHTPTASPGSHSLIQLENSLNQKEELCLQLEHFLGVVDCLGAREALETHGHGEDFLVTHQTQAGQKRGGNHSPGRAESLLSRDTVDYFMTTAQLATGVVTASQMQVVVTGI